MHFYDCFFTLLKVQKHYTFKNLKVILSLYVNVFLKHLYCHKSISTHLKKTLQSILWQLKNQNKKSKSSTTTTVTPITWTTKGLLLQQCTVASLRSFLAFLILSHFIILIINTYFSNQRSMKFWPKLSWFYEKVNN